MHLNELFEDISLVSLGSIVLTALGSLGLSYMTYRKMKVPDQSFGQYLFSGKHAQFKKYCVEYLKNDLKKLFLKTPDISRQEFEDILVGLCRVMVRQSSSWKLRPDNAKGAVMEVMRDFLILINDQVDPRLHIDADSLLHRIAKAIQNV